MNENQTLFGDDPDIEPVEIGPGLSATALVDYLGTSSFEARNVYRAAQLFANMIRDGDVIWLGVAGAGIAGGMGGLVISLLRAGFLDCICSTGAQVYHDLHFAFGLPVKAISSQADDDLLRRHGDTRIYDIGIREKETLEAQDELIRRFVRERHDQLAQRQLSRWQFIFHRGNWVAEVAPHPEKSFVVAAARLGVPLFWDSLANHSIAMNLARTDLEGYPISLSAQRDVLDSAAISFDAERSSFVELGGGGPKNFIQQTGPTISQILDIQYEGAQRGLQISTAVEREGSLSGCTFGEAVTWGKYRHTDAYNLVQIWGEYSIVFPLLCAYVLDTCQPRSPKRITDSIDTSRLRLVEM